MKEYIAKHRLTANNLDNILDKCPWTRHKPQCDTDKVGKDLKYRRSDGACNNLDEPNYGRFSTPLIRLLGDKHHQTDDELPRSKSNITGSQGIPLDLPSARSISQGLVQTASNHHDKERF